MGRALRVLARSLGFLGDERAQFGIARIIVFVLVDHPWNLVGGVDAPETFVRVDDEVERGVPVRIDDDERVEIEVA